MTQAFVVTGPVITFQEPTRADVTVDSHLMEELFVEVYQEMDLFL